MAQMNILDRDCIEGCLKRRIGIPEIAGKVGKSPQAITAEIKNRRIDSNKGMRPAKNFQLAEMNEAVTNGLKRNQSVRHVMAANPDVFKGFTERTVYEELRRILLKGTSFDSLDQDDINVVLSHVNSYTRASLGNSTPYDEFAKTYGHEGRKLLDRLGIVKIPANEVTLD